MADNHTKKKGKQRLSTSLPPLSTLNSQLSTIRAALHSPYIEFLAHADNQQVTALRPLSKMAQKKQRAGIGSQLAAL